MASTTSSSVPGAAVGFSLQLSPDATPPKSKLQPYYSIHPLWSNVEPIPQSDLSSATTFTSTYPHFEVSVAEKLASAGPALASIAYTPRYAEAMAYLRAVMAVDERSRRCLALTEDIIGMNPAHYTVWIYRFRVLRSLWETEDKEETKGEQGSQLSDEVRRGIEEELRWLQGISEVHLKNYQIWHHRTSLFSLLPTDITSQTPEALWVLSILRQEPSFLRHILSFDTKNYHVWSYRQWVSGRFPAFFLHDSASAEIKAMDVMIGEDVMNNSAWNHRWFLVFGHQVSQREDGSAAPIVDLDIIDREIAFAKEKIALEPQNGSSWNYLKGLLKQSRTPSSTLRDFVSEFVGSGFDFQHEDGRDGRSGVRSSQAIEMAIDIFTEDSRLADTPTQKETAREKVREGFQSLGQRWDPIRKRYWDWRLERLEQEWSNDG